MLYTKFRKNRPAASGKEDFEGSLPYMGVEAILFCCPDYLARHRRLDVE